MDQTQYKRNSESLLEDEADFMMGRIWKDAFAKAAGLKYHLKSILIAGIVFAFFAGVLSWIKHPTYTGRVNFVIEENKQNSGGLFSALAGQVGLDMSSLSGNSGILAGDNVLELLKSPTLLKKVLLSPDTEDSTISIAWAYATSYGWATSFSKIAGNQAIFKPVYNPPIQWLHSFNNIGNATKIDFH